MILQTSLFTIVRAGLLSITTDSIPHNGFDVVNELNANLSAVLTGKVDVVYTLTIFGVMKELLLLIDVSPEAHTIT